MKGNSVLFPNAEDSTNRLPKPENGKDYNLSKSSKIKDVDNVEHVHVHKMPIKGNKNTVIKNYDSNGNVITERYYDEKGDPYLDIDYTNHGNGKAHPYVPHVHEIIIDDNGKIKRGPGEKAI